jgi:DNA polymerase-1
VFVEADFSQIELRGCAEVADLPAMRQVYVDGRDLHCETATLVHGRLIAKTDPERTPSKSINFGTIYGCGPATLAYTVFKDYGIVITEDQARTYQEALFTICTGLKEWMKEQYARCQKLGYVEIGSGRIVEARWQPDFELRYTQAVNYPTQGICGECAKRALTRLHRRIRAAGLKDHIRIVNLVHDSTTLEVIEAEIARAAAFLEEEMLAAFVEIFPKASTRDLVEIKGGPNWGDMQPLEIE